METSFAIGPKTESLRKGFMSPFSVILTNKSDQDAFLVDFSIENIPRCENCKGYFSSLCNVQENYWECPLCGQLNQSEPLESKERFGSYEVILPTTFGLDIFVLCISLDFHADDIEIMKPHIIKLIQKIDRRVVICIPNIDGKIGMICPHIPHYYSNGGRIMESDQDFSMYPDYSNIPLPIAAFSRPDQIDLARYVIHPSQLKNAALSVNSFQSCVCDGVFPISQLILRFVSTLQLSPLHFTCILPSSSQIALFDRKIVTDSIFRVDWLCVSISESIISTTKNLNGLIYSFNKHTLFGILDQIASQQYSYNCYINSRTGGCSSEWKPLLCPMSFADENLIYVPTSSNSQPFVLDLHPYGNSDDISIQLTTKTIEFREKQYREILKIKNQKISVSNDINAVVNSINVPSLIWLWLIRTLEKPKRDVIAAIIRAAVTFLQNLPKDSQNYKFLLHSVCSLSHLDIYNSNVYLRLYQVYYLCLNSPSKISLVPAQIESVYVFLSQVYSDNNNDQASIHRSPVPDWIKKPEENTLAFINELLEE